jgi:lipopolysaccharide/colanic/teichoic acid biosynthesis glycosyltransferase
LRRPGPDPGPVERLVAAAALVILGPVMIVAATLVVVFDGWPPVFRQQRAGRGGRAITVTKIRTMRRDAPPPELVGQVRPGDPLVLPVVGELLRRSRADEIPQLLSIIRGEMRFVGPRPPLLSDVPGYSALERRRLEVCPGLTGWAQVNGNTQLSWPDRIALDLYYVDHRSWRLDTRIIVRTLVTVMSGERIDGRHLEEARRYADRLAGNGGLERGGAT